MSENIGMLTTPDKTGASITCTSNYFDTNDTELLNINNIGSIRTNVTDKYRSIELTSDLDTWDETGSAISLRSQYAEYQPSAITLHTKLNNDVNILLICPDGTLVNNYYNKDTNITESRKIDSIYSSSNYHIQYTNGLLIQWGRSYIPSNESTKIISFHLPYKGNDDNAYNIFVTSNHTNIISYIFHSYYKSASDFTVTSHLSDGTLLGNKYFKWLAIGYWK